MSESFTNAVLSGADALRNRARQSLTRRGLDYGEYEGDIGRAIESTFRRIDPNDANPGSYFTDDIVDNVLGRTRDDLRYSFNNAIGRRFAPGFENNYFKADSDDAFINNVLGTQKKEATDYVTRARDRGMLDATGYGAAMGRIGEMEATGRATANRLGDAVLQGNRTRLTDVANRAKSEAGQYELGQTFDLGNYDRQLNDTLGGLQGSLEGDVRGALEGQKFFEVGDLLARGGAAQGAVNPQLESAEAIALRNRNRNASRGLDGTPGGTF